MEQSAPSQDTEWTPRRVALATLVVVGVAAAFWMVIHFRVVFFSLFIAIVLSTAIAPLVIGMGRLGIPRALSIILISLLALLMIVAAFIIVVPLISEQWFTISALMSQWYENFHKMLVISPSLMIRRLGYQMPAILPLAAPTPSPTPQADTASQTGNLVTQAFAIGGLVVHDFIMATAVLLLTGLWILEGDIATRFFLMAAPAQRREGIRTFLTDIEQKVGAYTRGLLILTVIMGALAGIAYAIIGLPNVLLLGIAAGAMEIVPLVGPALGAIPALLVAASTDPNKVVWVLAAYVIIQLIESHLVVPRVMDRAVGVNPVASLLAFVAFGAIFGFLGAVLAVPLAAVIQLVLNRFVFSTAALDASATIGRNTISTLRYEAQNLMLDVRKQVREKGDEVSARSDRVEDAMEAIAQDLDSILAREEGAAGGSAGGGAKTNRERA